MRTSRNHYEALGLPLNATSAQIKRRYRELVRKFHPDVAKDKATSHRLFLQVNEAYEVLSDYTRRRAYDKTLDLEQNSTTGAPQQSRPRSNVAQLLKDAQFAFIQKRLNTAADLCKEALAIDPRSARACAMLGDIYRVQGKANNAIKHYTYAVQFDPSDNDSQKKLLNLMDKQVGSQRVYVPMASKSGLAVGNVIWWSIVFLLIMLIRVYPGVPIPWLKTYIPPISTWSWTLVGLIAVSSAIASALLSLHGLLRHPDDELLLDNSGSSWSIVPVGLILLICSGFFFLGAAAFYLIFGALQGSLSRSVLTVFGVVAGIVIMAAFLYEPHGRMQVLMFGGNVGFLSSLFGWYTGSAMKPLSAE